MVATLSDSPRDVRDRALLLLGFAAALRRSELVALTTADVAFDTVGLTVSVRRSKTDPEGRGRRIRHSPGARPNMPGAGTGNLAGAGAAAARHAAFGTGAAVSAHQQAWPDQRTGPDRPCGRRHRQAARHRGRTARRKLLGPFAARRLLHRCCPQHGAPYWQIRKISGHRSHAVLDRYIRDTQLFQDNPLEPAFLGCSPPAPAIGQERFP